MKIKANEQKVIDSMKGKGSYKSHQLPSDLRTLRELERKGVIKSYGGDSGQTNYYKV